MYYIYMIENAGNKLYIGISENISKRIYRHNIKQGALFTKNKSRFRVVFYEEYPTLADVRKREIQIKKWRRDKKEALIKRYSLGLPTKQ